MDILSSKNSSLLPGVDKIWLQTRDFSITDSSILKQTKTLYPGKSESELPLSFVDKKGLRVLANRVEYKSKREDLPYHVSIDRRGFVLNYNPSKIMHPYNLETDVSIIENITDAICNDLESNGIGFSLADCKLARLDFAKQDCIDNKSIRNFIPAFQVMGCSRMKGVLYETGYTLQNTKHEICFYDKGIESGMSNLNGLIRAEVRYKKNDVISKSLGLDNYGRFIKSDSNQWNESYNNYLNAKVFKFSYQTDVFNYQTYRELFEYTLNKYGRNNAVLYFLASVSVSNTPNRLGVEDCISIIKDFGFVKGSVSKWRNLLNEMSNISIGDHKIGVNDLIQELKLKFAA